MLSRPCLLSLVGVVAVVISLAGCSLLPGPSHGVTSAQSSKPVVGQCWNATAKQAFDWADWKGPAATACTGSHVLYTYQMGRIAGETANTWTAPGDSTRLSQDVQTKAEHACSITKLLPHEKWNQQLINAYFFVPTQQQWKAGARWVRCDVGVLATGTTLDNETFSALPIRISSFVREVASNPARFEFCINSPTPVAEAGPLDNPAAVLADYFGFTPAHVAEVATGLLARA